MDTLNRIKKNIKTLINMKGEKPEQIFITKKEAEELGIEEYDGVKLVVKETKKEEPGLKKDCVFYNGIDCNAMTELVCKEKRCKRYNTTITQQEIDKSIREYAIRRSK